MKFCYRGVLLFFLLFMGSLPLVAGQSRRTPAARAPVEDTGPVSVMRSATMRITITSDTIGIFEYLADPKKVVLWLPDQAVMEPQLGGKYHYRFRDTEGVWSGVVTEFIRGNTFGLTWRPPDEEFETNLRYKLSPQGADTIIELSVSGLTSSAALDKAVKYWVFYLQNLKSVIEAGTDMRGQLAKPPKRPAGRSRPR
jgi:uncharacterized protein YndB with AHSA1/START domain